MMLHKWEIARAGVCDEAQRTWVAVARAGSGVWVVRSAENEAFGDMAIVGACFPFDGEASTNRLLCMTAEERAELDMSDGVYALLNTDLAVSFHAELES